jgi:hypothetical protein
MFASYLNGSKYGSVIRQSMVSSPVIEQYAISNSIQRPGTPADAAEFGVECRVVRLNGRRSEQEFSRGVMSACSVRDAAGQMQRFGARRSRGQNSSAQIYRRAKPVRIVVLPGDEDQLRWCQPGHLSAIPFRISLFSLREIPDFNLDFPPTNGVVLPIASSRSVHTRRG